MQIQADLLGIPVVRPEVIETTALGAAFLAGLSCGVYSDLAQLKSLWNIDRIFQPSLPADQAAEHLARWERAVHQVTG